MEMRATVATDETLVVSFAPDWPLETERLVLRPFEPSDLAALSEIHGDEANARYLHNEARTREQVAELLERKIAGASMRSEGDWLSAAAVLRRTGKVVCDGVLLWASEAHQQGDRLHRAPCAPRTRYATEAARPLLAFAFGILGLHRVVGRLEPCNVASARVLEELGMRREAHFVENEWIKGE
jgi:RimJ/RimL family protein N-acetyltransferase